MTKLANAIVLLLCLCVAITTLVIKYASLGIINSLLVVDSLLCGFPSRLLSSLI